MRIYQDRCNTGIKMRVYHFPIELNISTATEIDNTSVNILLSNAAISGMKNIWRNFGPVTMLTKEKNVS